MPLTLTSQSFQHEQPIPEQYTCDAVDISPELSWSGVPEGTQSFVLIMDDPDAPMGIWDHWLLFNIPGDTTHLAENIAELPAGTRIGKNSWGKNTYGGPCPPDGKHRYYFKLFALDTVLDLPDGIDKKTLEAALERHVLDKTELMGTYLRFG